MRSIAMLFVTVSMSLSAIAQAAGGNGSGGGHLKPHPVTAADVRAEISALDLGVYLEELANDVVYMPEQSSMRRLLEPLFVPKGMDPFGLRMHYTYKGSQFEQAIRSSKLVVIDDQLCKTLKGKPGDAAVTALVPGTPICVSTLNLKKLGKLERDSQLLAILIHEFIHQFTRSLNETMPTLVQEYVIDQISPGYGERFSEIREGSYFWLGQFSTAHFGPYPKADQDNAIEKYYAVCAGVDDLKKLPALHNLESVVNATLAGGVDNDGTLSLRLYKFHYQLFSEQLAAILPAN